MLPHPIRLLLLAALFASAATAQPSFVADLARGGSGQPQGMTAYQGDLYFSARGSDSVSQLWTYDPETGQAAIVVSFDEGAADDGPSVGAPPFGFTVYDGRLFFAAPRGPGTVEPNYELWAYDATTRAVEFVAEIQPGPEGSAPREFTVYDDRLFFRADDGQMGVEMWVYDAATDAVEQVRDLAPGTQQSGAREFTVLDGILYFSAFVPSIGSELWAYDAATDAVTAVTDSDGSPNNLTVYDGRLFFNASDGQRRKLWVYDPSTEALAVVFDGPSERAGRGPQGLTVHNGRLFFSAPNVDLNDIELWAYDAATGSATLIADVIPGSDGSGPGGFVSFGNRLLFSAGVTDEFDRELWAYDGETVSIVPVDPDYRETLNDSNPYDLVVADGRLYFGATGSSGVELWSLDPGADSADPAAEIDSAINSNPNALAVLDGQLYFGARKENIDLLNDGGQLWTYDATTNEARLVADLMLTSGYEPRSMAAYAGRLYFSATDDTSGDDAELWAYDPVRDAAYEVADLAEGIPSSDPFGFTVVGDRLYFSALTETGSDLWSFDAATGPARIEVEDNVFSGIGPRDLTAFGDRLYFQGDNGTSRLALFVHDPATGETRSLTSDAVTQVTGLTPFGGRLAFAASDADSRGLWAYDPASDTVVRLAVVASDPRRDGVTDLAALDGRLYFSLVTEAEGRELWVYDEAGGARLAADLRPGPTSSDPTNLTTFGGELVFSAVSDTAGRELWALGDDGVRLAGDLSLRSSTPEGFTPYAGRLYFAATDTVHGRELWAYESKTGTDAPTAAAPTLPVAIDVMPNPSGANGARVRVQTAGQTAGQTVRVTVQDLLGREVLVLHQGEQTADVLDLQLPAGALAGGVYVVRVVGASVHASRAVTIIR